MLVVVGVVRYHGERPGGEDSGGQAVKNSEREQPPRRVHKSVCEEQRGGYQQAGYDKPFTTYLIEQKPSADISDQIGRRVYPDYESAHRLGSPDGPSVCGDDGEAHEQVHERDQRNQSQDPHDGTGSGLWA